ncbi:MAG: hypothetical protein HY078_12460 [Elusimicrobia bacterium]|nr:hypothetical protein [Elusimicrobiota bacterium]
MRSYSLARALLCLAAAGAPWSALAQQDCSPRSEAAEPIVLVGDLPFHQTLEEIAARFGILIDSGKRLEHRGYRDGGRFVVPFHGQHGESPEALFIAEFPDAFLDAVRTHVETALEQGYAVFPYYADLGHGHLLVPVRAFEELKARRRQGASQRDILEAVLAHPDLRILYHAAEQLVLPSDRRASSAAVRHLRAHRNFVASLREPRGLVVLPDLGGPNTHRSLPGYETGPTFYFAAARRGCVPLTFRGRSVFMDVGLSPYSE